MKIVQYIGVVLIWGPLFGMIGTCYAMIQAFQNIAEAGGMADSAFMAENISVALETTIIGLIIYPIGAALTIVATKRLRKEEMNQSRYGFWSIFFICLFLGKYGFHKFYTGRALSGFLYLFTLGGFFILYLYDLSLICLGKYKDPDGNLILPNKNQNKPVESDALQLPRVTHPADAG